MSAPSSKQYTAYREGIPPSTRSARRWSWLRWVAGAILLLVLVTFVGPRALIDIIRHGSPGWMLAVIAVSFAWLFLGGLNVWLLLRCLSPIRLSVFLRVYISSWAASLVLPSQLGDATQVLLLRGEGVATADSSAAYLLDKAISLGWMAVVSAYAVGLYTVQIRAWWLLAFVGLCASTIAAVVAIFLRLAVRPGGVASRAQRLLSRLIEQSLAFRDYRGAVARNISLTILKWVLMALTYWCAFRAFGIEIEVLAAATIPVLSSLVGYVPVTVGGIGTMEWTAVVLFGQVGVEGAGVVSVYLLIRAVLVLAAICLLALSGRRVRIGADQ